MLIFCRWSHQLQGFQVCTIDISVELAEAVSHGARRLWNFAVLTFTSHIRSNTFTLYHCRFVDVVAIFTRPLVTVRALRILSVGSPRVWCKYCYVCVRLPSCGYVNSMHLL